MIADSAEAAVRSCKERSRATVDKVVEKIINERMILRQFDDCDITMKELNVIRNTIVNNLTGVYHSRIEYPKIDIERLKTEEMV
jgi:membrane-associated HD superfamily phosphohydrolase